MREAQGVFDDELEVARSASEKSNFDALGSFKRFQSHTGCRDHLGQCNQSKVRPAVKR